MLTEFEVRRELDRIQESDASPRIKARKLIRLGKSLKKQSHSLSASHDVVRRNKSAAATRQFERLAMHSQLLREEVRAIALALLRAQSRFRTKASGW